MLTTNSAYLLIGLFPATGVYARTCQAAHSMQEGADAIEIAYNLKQQ